MNGDPENERLHGLLEEVKQAVSSASRLARRCSSQTLQITRKADGSPLSSVDLAINKLLQEHLDKLEPQLPILSEESDAPSFQVRQNWRRYWLVDPIDGTRGLIQGSTQFTINIALIEDQTPILGVIHIPLENCCYYAARGLGAFRQYDNGRATEIRSGKTQAPALRIICSRSRSSQQLDDFLRKLGPEITLEKAGSSLKACRVAEGSADLYPQFGATYEWDTAAAQCILEEASGALTDLELRPLRYNQKESLINPRFLAIADTDFPWRDYL